MKHISGPKSKKQWAIVSLLCVLALIAINNLIVPSVSENALSRNVNRVFAQQQALLEQSIDALVGSTPNQIVQQCIDQDHTTFQTRAICQHFAVYSYDLQAISPQLLHAYPANATRLDTLLRQNGWVNDRPHDSITTLVASNPYTNGGLGGNVPFHKNIGNISCNLEIDFNGLDETRTTAPGAINVNMFSCQQTVSFFELHWSTTHYQGV